MLHRSLVTVFMIALVGCAHNPPPTTQPSPRHVGVVTVLSAHTVLAVLQDGEAAFVCGSPLAQAKCVEPARHRAIASDLQHAFAIDGQALRVMRSVPADATSADALVPLLLNVSGLVLQVLEALPAGDSKDRLVTRVDAVGSHGPPAVRTDGAATEVDADNARLDLAIADAGHREARAARDAGSQ